MAYSNLKFELIPTGEQSGQWGNTTNTNIGTAIEQAIVGMATLTSADFSSNVATLTLIDVNTAQNARALCLNIAAGAVAAAGTINVPAIQKPYLIINGSSFAVTVKVSGQTGVSVPAGRRTVVYNNATDVGNQIDYLANLTLGTALPITSGGTGTTSTTFVNLATNVTGTLPIAGGGTGATTASVARTNLGATTLGDSMYTLANPSAVTFPRFNADNTVSALDAASFRSAIGAGTGGGSVTSVGGTGTVNGITLTGTVTSSGNLTLGGTLSNVSLSSQVTGTLPLASGGTGATTAATARTNLGATPVGSNLFGLVHNIGSGFKYIQVNSDQTVSTLDSADFRTAIGAGTVNSVGGTGSVNGITLTGTVTTSGNLTLGGTLSNVSLSSQVTGTLPVASGGTGTTTPALVAGTNVTITGTWPNQTINSSNPGGTVTSVSGTAPVSVTNGTTTPTISMPAATSTTNGYLTSTNWNTFNDKLSSGGALGTPSSGNLVNCTFPTLNQNTTGTAAGLSSILAVASGGTGTATPSLVAGTNVTISGTWPNQTINASGGGGSYTTNGIAYADSTTTLATGTALTFNGTLMTLGTPALAKRFSIGGDTLTNTTFSIESTTSTSVAPIIQLHRSNSTLNNLQTVGGLSFTRLLSDTTQVTAAQIFVTGSNNSASQAASMFLESYTDFKFRLYNTGSTVEKMRLDVNGYLLVNYTSSNGAYPLQVNGQIFATSSTIATSDARYKENVTTLDGALDVVKALRPVQFNWKQHATHNFDTQTPTIGFLAQEVQQVLADKPYLNSVIKSSDCVTQEEELNDAGDIVKEKITEEFLGIAESNLIAILTKAMQEQQTQIEALTARLNAANL